MKIRKCAKGGGVIFIPKNYIADFGIFKQGFLITKLIQNINFWVQGIFFQQLYWEKSTQDTLWRRHFWIPILSGHHTSSHICNHIYHKKSAILWGAGSKAVWNFSENSSDLVARLVSNRSDQLNQSNQGGGKGGWSSRTFDLLFQMSLDLKKFIDQS